MPDRFWVGGTDSWNGTAGTKWSTTSGGPGGASVPTAADDVFFTNLSTGTCTIAAGNLGARSINCTGFAGTITGSDPITVSGSVTLSVAMTWTHGNTVTFNGTGTLTTAGKLFSAIVITGATTVLTLGDDFNQATFRTITITQGTFNTANFNVNAGTLVSSNTNIRTINLGSSTLTLAGITFTTTTSLTFNAGTSLINIVQDGAVFNSATSGPIPVFNNVSFTSLGSSATTIGGSSVFNNLSFTAPGSARASEVSIQAGFVQTINGTLSTTTGTVGNRRVWFRSTTYGISTSLIVNSAVNLTDTDFRDVIVTGTAAPISGTRIGDLRGNGGITFSVPKTVFRLGTGNWSDNQWATASGAGGTVSLNNFPLAQDTAVFDQNTTTGTHTMDSAVPYCGTVNMSARTASLTLSISAAQTIYGNWINGSGITLVSNNSLTFSGRNNQTITTEGKTFGTIFIDSYGGAVTLNGALSISGANTFNVVNGTFDTAGFAFTGSVINSSNTNVRTINLRSSTVTLISSTPISLSTTTNLTFDAGSSQINLSAGSAIISANVVFNNVSFTYNDISSVSPRIDGNNTFRNLTVTSVGAAGFIFFELNGNQIITETLSVSGASPIRRTFVRSNTLGVTRTLTVGGTLAATNCDFRDITIAGAAAGSSPTRAGDCGGNSGITFPAPKTVFWNLAGSQLWSATGWATTSGGTPAINNFPLAQDTAVFNNASAISGVTVEHPWNIGSINASSRTNSMTIDGTSTNIHGSWTSGTGLLAAYSGGALTFVGRGTNTITSNGVFFNAPIVVNCLTGTIQLADAITSTETITLTSGTFDAVTFNTSVSSFSSSSSNVRSLRMGSGTWTLTGSGTVWNLSTVINLNFNKGTANIVLSGNTTLSRTFIGGGLAYNRLTIGGTTSTSTTTITGNNSFIELASTKTVAHTIAFGTTAQTFGAWTVTGTVGNVVTLTGTNTNHVLAGAATSGIDYLAMGSIGFAPQSPGEFFAGANSTGTAGTPVFRTARPVARTLYWVGGSGDWNNSARWSLSSGGPGGEVLPRSFDDVIVNSASSASAYQINLNINARCNQLTITGPASGNVTLAGGVSVALILHGNTSFPATGLTRTFTSPIILSGSTSGKTFASNGVVFSNDLTVNGVGAGWSMSTALNLGNAGLIMLSGTFSTNNFNLTSFYLDASGNVNNATLNLGSSTITLSAGTFISFSAPNSVFTFNAGTSQINVTLGSGAFALINSSNVTFHNMTLTPTTASTGMRFRLGSTYTFNNLTFNPPLPTGVFAITMETDRPMTVNGTLTFTAPADATRRYFISQSFTTIGTPYTISCGAFSGTDVDFRDIVITGTAAPISGTRLGDLKGNSGITFTAPKTVYWNLAGGGNWSSAGWATTSGGTPAINNFPLAQDTCIFEATGLNSGATITMNTGWHVGTVNMSARTTNTMTLSLGNSPTIYGNLINGTGVSFAGTGTVTYAGRTAQTITSAGVMMGGQSLSINSPGGSVTLQDALSLPTNVSLFLTQGTLNTNSFNVSVSAFNSSGTLTRSLIMGSSVWTMLNQVGSLSNMWDCSSSTNLTISGSGQIRSTGTQARTFNGGSFNYSGITLVQFGGAATLTITGNNTFRGIDSMQTSDGNTTILLGTTTQTVTEFFRVRSTGPSQRVTVQGTIAALPATLIYTGTSQATNTSVNQLTLIGVRAYPLLNTWYAGNNSTNGGTLGWIFEQTPAILPGNGNFFLMFI